MPTLVFSDVDGIDRTFELGLDPVLIGRGMDCTLRSDDPRVSRMHARIFWDHGALWIEDLGSANGVFLGGNRVTRATVPIAEVIIVGSLIMRVMPETGTMPPPNGVHGTLAQWLALERKTRAAVESERNALAERVGQLHNEVQTLVQAVGDAGEPSTITRGEPFIERESLLSELANLRAALGEAEHKRQRAEQQLTRLEQLAPSVPTQIVAGTPTIEGQPSTTGSLAELALQLQRLTAIADEARAAQANAEAEAQAERVAAATLHQALAEARAHAERLEADHHAELALARQQQTVASTQDALSTVAQLATADARYQALERAHAKLTDELTTLKLGLQQDEAVVRAQAAQARALAAEQQLEAERVRSQGAERAAHAAAQRASATSQRLVELEAELAQLRNLPRHARHGTRDESTGIFLDQLPDNDDRVIPVEDLEASSAPVSVGLDTLALLNAETEIERLRGELRRAQAQLAMDRPREAGPVAEDASGEAEFEAHAHRTPVDEPPGRPARYAPTVEQAWDTPSIREAQLQAQQLELDRLTAELISARAELEATRQAQQAAENKATAADTMAKALSKDVTDAMRRAADAEKVAKQAGKELAALQQAAQTVDELSAARLAAEALATDSQAQIQQALRERDEHAARLQHKVDAYHELARNHEVVLAELDELKQRQLELERERADLVVACQRAQREAAASQAQLAADLSAHASLRAAEAALQAALAEATARGDAATQTQRTLRDELENLQTTLAATDESRQRAESELARLQLELAAAQAAGQQLAAEAHRMAEQVEAANVARNAAEDRLAVAEAAHARAAASRLTDEQAFGEAAAVRRQLDEALYELGKAQQLATRRPADESAQLINELTQQVSDAAAQHAEQQQSLTTALAQLEAAQAANLAMANELEAARTEVANLQALGGAELAAELTRLSQTLELTRDELANTKAQLSRAHDEVALLTQDLAEHEALRQAQAAAAVAHGVAHATSARALATGANGFSEEEATAVRHVLRTGGQGPAAEPARLHASLGGEHRHTSEDNTGVQLAAPPALADQLLTLEESIDSLRANMRAAHDEAALLPPSESALVIRDAVEQAQTHLQSARTTLRTVMASFDGLGT